MASSFAPADRAKARKAPAQPTVERTEYSEDAQEAAYLGNHYNEDVQERLYLAKAKPTSSSGVPEEKEGLSDRLATADVPTKNGFVHYPVKDLIKSFELTQTANSAPAGMLKNELQDSAFLPEALPSSSDAPEEMLSSKGASGMVSEDLQDRVYLSKAKPQSLSAASEERSSEAVPGMVNEDLQDCVYLAKARRPSSSATSEAVAVLPSPYPVTTKNTFVNCEVLSSFQDEFARNPSSSAPPEMLNQSFHLKHRAMEEAHIRKECKPCAYITKQDGCRHGDNCEYCHLCPAGELKKRKKEKQSALRAKDRAEREAGQRVDGPAKDRAEREAGQRGDRPARAPTGAAAVR